MPTHIATFNERAVSRSAGRSAIVQRYLRQRFRYFIEHSDWDEVLARQDEWIDKFCTGIIIVASLYFIPPVLVMSFLR